MKMKLMVFVLLAAFSFTGFTSAYAAGPVNHQIDNKQVKLTEQQKSELAKLTKDLFEKKKQLVSKYAEYGVIPKERADKIISHLNERYAKMEKNGFMPHWKHHHHKSHQE